MIKRLSWLLVTLFIVSGSFAQMYEPVKWTHELKITGETTADIVLRATIDEGWHLYGLNLPKGGPRATSVVFEKLANADKAGEIQSPSKLLKSYDANFDMELNWYANEVVFIQKITFRDVSKVNIKGYIEYMTCNDQSCLPPRQEPFTIGAPASALKVHQTVVSSAPVQPTNTTTYWEPVIKELKEYGESAGLDGTPSLWFIFLTGLLGGFLALFTPCVWPVIPMTVSFFLKRSDNKAPGRRDAFLYGLAIVFIYVFLGILITLIFGASAMNSLSTSALFNIIFFALLVVFAISFFGAFEITLPGSWSTKLDAKADSTAGFLSILFMAFTLVLVSFSCTGPIIGLMLVKVSTSGSILAPAIGMLGFAVALSIPFTLFAFFPVWLKSMPRSGGWLNSVKVVLAFLELAFALKFLSVADLAYGWHILDREVFLSIWIVLFALLGLYLLGKLRFPHDSESTHTSVTGVFLAILSFAFSIYMIPGLWGAPLKAVSAFAPPLYTQDFNLYKDEVRPAFTDYDLGMAYAAGKKLPVIVDFSGYGCVNCRKMEASVWTDPRVKNLLNDQFVLISLFVDDKTELPKAYSVNENGRITTIKTVGDKWSYLQRVKFGANAQPFYVMLNNQGKPMNKAFSYDEDPVHFERWLLRK